MRIVNYKEDFNPKHIKQYISAQQIPVKIIEFLKNQGDFVMLYTGSLDDPVTGEFVRWDIEYKELGNFEWSDVDIYMIEKYNVELCPEFLDFVKDKI